MAGAAPAPDDDIAWQQILPVPRSECLDEHTPAPAPVAPRGGADDDDARSTTNARLLDLPSSSSIDTRTRALAREVADHWGVADVEHWIWRYGAAHVDRVHRRLLYLERQGQLRRVRSLSGYFMTTLWTDTSSNGHRHDLPPTEHTEPPPQLTADPDADRGSTAYSRRRDDMIAAGGCPDCDSPNWKGEVRHKAWCPQLAPSGGDA